MPRPRVVREHHRHDGGGRARLPRSESGVVSGAGAVVGGGVDGHTDDADAEVVAHEVDDDAAEETEDRQRRPTRWEDARCNGTNGDTSGSESGGEGASWYPIFGAEKGQREDPVILFKGSTVVFKRTTRAE